ncbi:hypothetical protein ACFX1Z_024701 [Malus domestica]
MPDSSEEENGGPIMPTSRHQSAITAEPSKEPSEGQCQKVFDRLSLRKQTDGSTSIRRRLDFDPPFYNEDYYSRNSNSLSSLVNPKPLGHLNHMTNDGTATILPPACIPRFLSLRNIDVSV